MQETITQEVKSELVNLSIEKAHAYLSSAESFATEQAPLLVQEALQFHFFMSIDFIVVSFIVFCISLYFSIKCFKLLVKTDNPAYIIGAMAATILAIFSPIFMIGAIYDLLLVTLAPRLFLLDRFAEMIN